jgi:hypothetical protein
MTAFRIWTMKLLVTYFVALCQFQKDGDMLGQVLCLP